LFSQLACGPSAEERRSQEIQDSIRLEQERQELIERANRILEGREQDDDDDNVVDSEHQDNKTLIYQLFIVTVHYLFIQLGELFFQDYLSRIILREKSYAMINIAGLAWDGKCIDYFFIPYGMKLRMISIIPITIPFIALVQN
jgi:hypothetical protein